MVYFKITFLLLILTMLLACKKPVVEPIEKDKPLSFYQPNHFPNPVYSLDQNPITREKFELGRELFYSTLLSLDNSISCASCHTQTHAFSDHNVALSSGVGGAMGVRNSPAIFNLAWQPHFNWDGGVNHLEIFPLAPITNEVEMKESMLGVVNKLKQSTVWKGKFLKAFGTNEIDDQKIFLALTQYMLMIVSDKSLYDDVKRGKATFNEEQQKGYDLFLQKCASCHTEPLFTDFSFRNNGLDLSYSDIGRMLITQNASDNGKFKVPTLRNVLLTYPYMHDGRFFTIDQVLEHYSSGVQSHINLDPNLQNGFPLSADDKKYLKRFLETLNDYELLSNTLLSEP